MLFGYPEAAIKENWFHECLIEMLKTIHTCQQTQQPLSEWPEFIPESYREKLSSRRGLKDRLIAYQKAIAKLSKEELTQVINAIDAQNDIQTLLSGRRNCEKIDELPKQIHETVKDLFTFAFELLTDLGVRDQQYQIIYEEIPYRVCPFCGCEYFDAPAGPREALAGCRKNIF